MGLNGTDLPQLPESTSFSSKVSEITSRGDLGSVDELMRCQPLGHPTQPALQSRGLTGSSPHHRSPSPAAWSGTPMEAARCQLGKSFNFPSLRKWTMSLLVRYPPRGQMSALIMAFLSSSLPRLRMALQRSVPIASPGSAHGAAPCQPSSTSPPTPTPGLLPPPPHEQSSQGFF